MNNAENRTYLDMKQWNPNIGKTFYELHPNNKDQYRTIYVHWNAFQNCIRPMISNYVTGEPPEEMQPMHPLLMSQLNTIPIQSPF